MIRIAKPTNPEKIQELKRKIDTSRYLNVAVSGIASILTTGLLHWNGSNLNEHDSDQ